jgi:TRAP-type C4-dicarboxylate transport system permease small subunit
LTNVTAQQDGTSPLSHGALLAEGPVERVCAVLCEAAIAVMLIVIGTDVFTRAVFNYSFEISDEMGGYMLVLITFVSMSVCQVGDSFHHVEFVQARLSPFGRSLSRLIFDLVSLAAGIILLWQMVRLEISSWHSGDTAPTYLATPLWLPRTVMLVGIAALCLALVRTIVLHARRLRRGRAGAPAP